MDKERAATKTEERGAKLNSNRGRNDLVPMTRGQDEGLSADYLAYIPSLYRVTKEIVKTIRTIANSENQ